MLYQQARLWFARDNGLEIKSDVAHIEAELGFAAILIRAVAEQAIFGQYGANVAIKANGLGLYRRTNPSPRPRPSQEQKKKPLGGDNMLMNRRNNALFNSICNDLFTPLPAPFWPRLQISA
jgi:hypothetical protein